MAQEGYPADPRTWQSYLAIEADAAAQARYCVFTTPGAARIYQQRYPAAASRMVVLENGYDEESFASAALPPQVARAPADGERPLLMLHSGIVYPSERDPTQLFAALGHLQKAGTLSPADLRIRFRASVRDDLLQSLAQTHGAQDFIELCPALPYREALSEITSSKSELESLLGEPVTLFGYPNGKPDVDYSAKHVAMVRQAGYVAAVSTAPGVAMWTSDIYQLPRFTPWDRTRSRYGMRLLANLRRSASQVVASTVT